MEKKTIEKIENAERDIIKFDGCYISYNGHCNLEPPHDETALVKDGYFYILYGDYRKEMKEAIERGGFEEAKKFFDNKPDEKSFWSN